MPKLISAKYHLDKRIVECVADNGDRQLRYGGSVCWRFNNPGNLTAPEVPRYTKNFIGIGVNGNNRFFIFPDYATGRAELKAHLLRKHRNKHIAEAMESYAPQNENKTAEYTAFVLKETRLPKDKLIGAFTPDELERFMNAIEKFEGYHSDTQTRQEKWVRTTSVAVSNGARPIPDKEFIVRKGGTDTPVRTNAAGKLPPIVHSPKEGPIELFFRDAKNGLVSLLKILPDSPSKLFQLISDGLTITAPTATHTPPAKPPKAAPAPMKYVVRPGDTASLIAKRFRIGLDHIKANNPQIKDLNRLYPGDVIHLFGQNAVAQSTPKAAPKNPRTSKAASSESSQQTGVKSKTPAATPALPPTGSQGKSPPPQPKAQNDSDDGVLGSVGQSVRALLGRSNEGQGKPVAIIPPAPAQQAPWMKHALNEAKRWAGKDEKEITKTSNYHKLVDPKNWLASLSGDPNAWCSSFVIWCIKQEGYTYNGNEYFRAGSYLRDKDNFAQIDEPVYGAIAVFKRPKGHHVVFVCGIERGSKNLVVLGGNQGDRITFVQRPAGKDLKGYFVPSLYKSQALREIESGQALPSVSANELNDHYGIVIAKSKKKES